MSNFFSLIFAIAFGLFLGTLPGVREKMPWGERSSDIQTVQVMTPVPAVPTTRAQVSSATWMQQKGRTSLDQPNSGASCSNKTSGQGTTMLSR